MNHRDRLILLNAMAKCALQSRKKQANITKTAQRGGVLGRAGGALGWAGVGVGAASWGLQQALKPIQQAAGTFATEYARGVSNLISFGLMLLPPAVALALSWALTSKGTRAQDVEFLAKLEEEQALREGLRKAKEQIASDKKKNQQEVSDEEEELTQEESKPRESPSLGDLTMAATTPTVDIPWSSGVRV